MRTADLLVDFGPGPGVRGGEIVATGDIAKLCRTKKSVTGAYLSGRNKIEIPTTRRPVTKPARGGRKKQPKGAPRTTRRSRT